MTLHSVAQARTGTGKTIGFLLPVIQRIIQADPSLGSATRGNNHVSCNDIKAIIISPTRELAEQIGEEARKLCRRTGIKVQTAVGGMNKAQMLRKTKFEGCHLLVGTPGRLQDLLSDEYSGIDAPNLAALVLDEADRMLDVGFERELQDILQLLPDRRKSPRQTLLFSATIPKDVVQLARTYVDASNFQFVQTINPNEAPTHEKVPQHIVTVPGFEHFIPALLEIAEKAQSGAHGPDPFKAIVFFNNTDTVKMFGELFEVLPRYLPNLPPAYSIHSGLDQRNRTRAADTFRKARSAILISTDVTARGMDFPNVTHVIQYGAPPARDQYIHRLGRTGRANKSGQGWLILRKEEVPEARRRLPGLPIKRNDELESARVDTVNQDAPLPQNFRAVNDAMSRVRRFFIEDGYRKFITSDRSNRPDELQQTVDAANWWVKFQGQLQTPPDVSPSLLKGVPALARVNGLNFGNVERRRGGDSGGYTPRSGGGGYGGRGDRDGRDSRDPFSSMSRGRRDERPRYMERAAF